MSRRYKYNTLILENGRNVYFPLNQKTFVVILYSNEERDYKECNKRWLEKRIVRDYIVCNRTKIPPINRNCYPQTRTLGHILNGN